MLSIKCTNDKILPSNNLKANTWKPPSDIKKKHIPCVQSDNLPKLLWSDFKLLFPLVRFLADIFALKRTIKLHHISRLRATLGVISAITHFTCFVIGFILKSAIFFKLNFTHKLHTCSSQFVIAKQLRFIQNRQHDLALRVSKRHGAVYLDGFYFVVFILILRDL